MKPIHRLRSLFRSILLLLAFIFVLQWFPCRAVAAAATLEDRVSKLEGAQTAINAGDNAWLLTSSPLALMMTAPGLALFYGGLVRTKNVLATMMQSMFLMGFMSLLWMLYGYSLAFGEGNAF